ncbi:hypothetical protein FACI_IFERC00001G0947 [Ferroplasma acidarmanus Fer1]|uniref:Uncharacterized protein n=1 Tax=Ferroplasma acidarmanus Fer1 TaxID=333146 RepID=S0AQ92_FERAC|nr:hypothetical protein FACI_IFERC00001G0947 [Ferroplasma acidarmanus Fer1]
MFINFSGLWINKYIGFYCNGMLKRGFGVAKAINYKARVYFQWKLFIYKCYESKKLLIEMKNNTRTYIGGGGVYFLWK